MSSPGVLGARGLRRAAGWSALGTAAVVLLMLVPPLLGQARSAGASVEPTLAVTGTEVGFVLVSLVLCFGLFLAIALWRARRVRSD